MPASPTYDAPVTVQRWLIAAGLVLVVAAAVASGVLATRGGHAWDGSTSQGTWVDPRGTGTLERGPGEPLLDRTALAPQSRPVRTLATFVAMGDPEILDAQSPARLEMLDRYGAPFTSAFRPQETLTGQVFAASLATVDAVHPNAVVFTGDMISNDQENELDEFLAILRGGRVDPDSGAPGYEGVQAAGDPDPYYYRPAVDPPRHPGLLAAAVRPFESPGVSARWYPVVGDHDLLVLGNLPATPDTNAIATGSRKLVSIDAAALHIVKSGQVRPRDIDALLAQGLPGTSVRVTPDPRRRELAPAQMLARLRRASGVGGHGALLDYTFPIGHALMGIALDTVSRAGSAEGVVRASQVRWLRAQLEAAGRRSVLVFSHSALTSCSGGDAALSLLDHDSHVVALVSGGSHRSAITPRHTPGGGYWMISTSSLVDYPQQARAFRLERTANGGLVLETWMLDPDPSNRLAAISMQLAYLDFQGGRPQDFAGGAADRNASLYLR
jgi:3',5'-cyclic AMP phosphodiesterase CpdA